MNSERLNRWLALGANIGVLVGLILIIMELDQNRDMMRAQTRNELSQGVLGLLSMTAENRDLADVIARADQGEELSAAEAEMFGSRSESVLRYWENVHYQYRQGLYDEVEFTRHLDTMKSVLLNSPALTEFWCDNRMLYSNPFMIEIDNLLDNDQCDV